MIAESSALEQSPPLPMFMMQLRALIDLEERDKFLAFVQQEVGKLQKQTS